MVPSVKGLVRLSNCVQNKGRIETSEGKQGQGTKSPVCQTKILNLLLEKPSFHKNAEASDLVQW